MNTQSFLASFLFCLLSGFFLNSTAADRHAHIRLITTTSVLSSGLLPLLKTSFEADTGYVLEVEVIGTGRALRRAREGYADVLIVHSPAAEQKFMRAGYGFARIPLMKNKFILVGPEADPANVVDSVDIISAFKAIAANQARFISRGDDSGTHKKELEIWQKSGIEPYGKWYIEYGHGMGITLLHADEMNAYILVDKATWLAKRGQLKLKQLLNGDALLDNPYHIISVSPLKHAYINIEGATQFILWMTSKPGQDIIRDFTIEGERLFTPAGNL